MQETEAPTREEFEEQLQTAQDNLAQSQLDLEQAIAALEEVKGLKNIDTMELVDLATKVVTATSAVPLDRKSVV